MRKLLTLYGALDLFLILWIASASLRGSSVLGEFTESMTLAKSFGASWASALAIAPYVILASIAISGPLLLLRNKWGTYLALLQTPFRLAGVVQPSLFFLVFWKGVGAIYILQIAMVVLFEIFKAVSLIFLLKRRHCVTPMAPAQQ